MNPDFDELVGEEPTGPERERLEHVHGLLLRAGPPPELPASLVRASVRELRPASGTRNRAVLLLLAATLALVIFGAGYLVGGRSASSFAWTAPMKATAAAPHGASATLSATRADASGNWRMSLTVSGLERLPGSAYYVVYLVRHGKRIAPCGFFNVGGRTATTVQMTVPYPRTAADGWIVVAYRPSEQLGPALLST